MNSYQLRKPKAVLGPRLRFRDARLDDAEFILSLRLDPDKGRHLSSTSSDLAEQCRWLAAYQLDQTQVYFIIEDSGGSAVGTVRIYDVQGSSFSWGSWIIAEGAPKSSAVESTLMVYHFGLKCGFTSAHFDVRRDNEKVWRYHERLGAERFAEDASDYRYNISLDAINRLFVTYSSRLPQEITIEWL